MRYILYADDHRLNRKHAEAVFAAQHWDFDTASSAEEAITKLELKEYDVVITDIMMPLMDGLQLAEHIGRHYPATTLLFITSYVELINKIEYKNYGVNCKGFIERPLTPTKVRMKLGLPCPNNVLQFNKGVV